MKKLITTLLVILVTINIYSQAPKGMVRVDLKYDDIITPDSLSEATKDEFIFTMERNPIDYEKHIGRVKAIELVDRDRNFVSEFKDGVIYINKRLDYFPHCKRAAILQEFAKNNGMLVDNEKRESVTSNFNITDYTEEMFRRQKKARRTLNTIVDKLIERSPLRTN